MARNHTASTTRGASVANATKAATDLICQLEDKAATEAFGLGHLAELMEVWGDHVGTPYADWSNKDMQQIGLRIEYLGGVVKRHAEAIGATLQDMRNAAERLQRGGAA
jgi:hypothetical protein